MAKTIDCCLHCGRTEEDHCTFVAVSVPDTCICHPRDWNEPTAIPAVCATYKENPKYGYCEICQHLEECHANQENSRAA